MHYIAGEYLEFTGRDEIVENMTRVNKEQIQGAGVVFSFGKTVANHNGTTRSGTSRPRRKCRPHGPGLLYPERRGADHRLLHVRRRVSREPRRGAREEHPSICDVSVKLGSRQFQQRKGDTV